jgi:hypothetical protein
MTTSDNAAAVVAGGDDDELEELSAEEAQPVMTNDVATNASTIPMRFIASPSIEGHCLLLAKSHCRTK